MHSSAAFLSLSKKAKIHGREGSNLRDFPIKNGLCNFLGRAQKEFE